MVQHLNEGSFHPFLEQEKPVVVDFYATWCPPCERLSPILEEIANEYSDDIAIGKLDIDESPSITERFGVMSAPTILVFHKGQVVNQFVGYRPKQNLIDLLGLGVL
ncbi:thioredoxin [Alicyclobacillus fastidiosus]|uniref:Thioredoxin n=1 Tax=Alicyclobacillus fastidiosus TaxID=392011 RepID=A0ABV5ABS9_9BACL|nr:thioredoxin [Alicyclobacillus fastidiosus]WEH10309.1 thioredoxin [Alicyclobacillus fastidiosus]